jgi:hypothetical protein
MHKLQHHVAIVLMQSGEDLFLTALRERLNVLEVWKLRCEPGCCDL